ncbi:MAG: carbamate kinase [Candidatus Magasanikbacteria bacterium]|nr:carbamate kinase [Candidatus Magasanikbacteria bacterium]
MTKRIVIAVGGNALIADKDHQSETDQSEQVKKTCAHIIPLIVAGHEVVITHGNGPQVGFILQRSEMCAEKFSRIPIDTAGAQTQGAIGYYFVQNLKNLLQSNKLEQSVCALVTQTLVNKNDESFQKPSKPIGSFWSPTDAAQLDAQYGWTMKEDAGRGFRRVVASPMPIDILEKDIIKKLLADKTIVIAGGGGGVPVIKDEQGQLSGIEAVIDKDRGSAHLANEINADALIIATAVDFVYVNLNKDNQKNWNR